MCIQVCNYKRDAALRLQPFIQHGLDAERVPRKSIAFIRIIFFFAEDTLKGMVQLCAVCSVINRKQTELAARFLNVTGSASGKQTQAKKTKSVISDFPSNIINADL